MPILPAYFMPVSFSLYLLMFCVYYLNAGLERCAHKVIRYVLQYNIRYGLTVQETEYSKNIKRKESMISLALKNIQIHVMEVIFNSFIYVKLNINMIDQTFSKFQSF